MAHHPIRKFFGLIVLYSVIILGIFALQFRSQSIFSKNFAQLRLTLSKNKQESVKQEFIDTFHIVYKGMTLYSDNDAKPTLHLKNGSSKTLTFVNWNEINDSSFQLIFDNNVSILCGITGNEKNTLTVSAKIPSNANNISIPYKFAKAYTVTNSTGRRITLKSNNMQTALTAPIIQPDVITLSPVESTFTYANFKPVTTFAFDTISDNPLAQADFFMQNKKNIKTSCVNLFTTSIDNLTETAVNAYMAEMTAKNKYLDAIALIPDSYKSGSRRTYLTAPYLNNLVAMNSTLVMQLENLNYRMTYSLEKQNLSIFESDNLAQFLQTLKTSQACLVLQLPASLQVFEPTPEQAAGILNTYKNLIIDSPEMANLLSSVLDTCLQTIESNCTLENEKLYVSSNNERLTSMQSIRIGKALIDYGAIIKNTTVQTGGYLLVNSQIPSAELLDLRTASDIYSILEEENTFYPHLQNIAKDNGNSIWAWTVAQSIGFSKDEQGTISFLTQFPIGATHYMIINNIEPFKSIEIYGMKFRTDPRFETYNSSGYVYNAKSKTLFLKYRQKAEHELVKLFYIDEEPEESNVETATNETTSPDATAETTATETTTEQPVATPVVNDTVSN